MTVMQEPQVDMVTTPSQVWLIELTKVEQCMSTCMEMIEAAKADVRALYKTTSATSNVSLALLYVLTEIPAQGHGGGSNLPIETATEKDIKREIICKKQLLQPFVASCGEPSRQAELYVERSDKRRWGLCHAVSQLGASRLYMSTKRQFVHLLGKGHGKDADYCIAHLPAYCNLVIFEHGQSSILHHATEAPPPYLLKGLTKDEVEASLVDHHEHHSWWFAPPPHPASHGHGHHYNHSASHGHSSHLAGHGHHVSAKHTGSNANSQVSQAQKVSAPQPGHAVSQNGHHQGAPPKPPTPQSQPSLVPPSPMPAKESAASHLPQENSSGVSPTLAAKSSPRTSATLVRSASLASSDDEVPRRKSMSIIETRSPHLQREMRASPKLPLAEEADEHEQLWKDVLAHSVPNEHPADDLHHSRSSSYGDKELSPGSKPWGLHQEGRTEKLQPINSIGSVGSSHEGAGDSDGDRSSKHESPRHSTPLRTGGNHHTNNRHHTGSREARASIRRRAEKRQEVHHATEEEIMQATKNFDEDRIIGKSGYGWVYRGVLQGVTVAIKHLKETDLPKGEVAFQKEVELQATLHHPHILRVLAYCLHPLCLVTEFMAQGSLYDRLMCTGGSKPLHWSERFEIFDEICQAVLFLHSRKPPLIDFDIKPANILLDNNFSAKLSDVCQAHFLDDLDHLDAREETHHHLEDLIGHSDYADPDPAKRSCFTVKADVYSLGMVLCDLLTGISSCITERRAFLEHLEGSLGHHYSEPLMNLLDPSAGPWPVGVATALAKLAVKCCKHDRKHRLSSVDKMLEMVAWLRADVRYGLREERLEEDAADELGGN